MMHLPPLQPLSDADICVSGDVTIHPRAVVAPGVVLQAAPNSRIIIGEGACIGMGAILNACQGIIEVGTGAVLGAGVLIFGSGKIGKNACIGTATTIFKASVAQMSVIPAGSLIGDTSSQVEVVVEPEQIVVGEGEEQPEVELATERAEVESPSQSEKKPVVGQVYVNNLLCALFPDRG